MWQRFGEFRAALAVFGEFEFAGEQRRVRLDKRVFLAHHDFLGHGLAVVFGQHRLVIEQIELARRAAHEQINDARGVRFEVGLFRSERVGRRGSFCRAESFVRAEQRRERHRAEAHAALLEEPAAGDEVWVLAEIEMGLAVHNAVNDKCSISNDQRMTTHK